MSAYDYTDDDRFCDEADSSPTPCQAGHPPSVCRCPECLDWLEEQEHADLEGRGEGDFAAWSEAASDWVETQTRHAEAGCLCGIVQSVTPQILQPQSEKAPRRAA